MKDKQLGKIEVFTLPLPVDAADLSGTYTPSGRVLAAYRTAEDSRAGRDYYHVLTLDDDGGGIQEVYTGMIPQRPTANGIRWMCFWDNRRVLLGDYVLEAAPDLDHPESVRLLEVKYPEALLRYPGLFRHWSEIIVAPDGEHMAWTMLTLTGAANFLGNLVRQEGCYELREVYCISTCQAPEPDREHEGYVIPQVLRGGELKQFIQGGQALSLVGNSDSLSDSVIEELNTGRTVPFSHTAGYEETAIFSPDEELALCMSPRFSPATDCGILGLVPLPHSMYVRGGIINPAYQYAIGSQRAFRMGNIGPALVSVQATLEQGRAYRGVDLSDPENRYVYYSPMSWSPCSTKALWNEHTRLSDPEQKGRLRIVRLPEKAPGKPVPLTATPSGREVPYALPLAEFLAQGAPADAPYRIKGRSAGEIVCRFNGETGYRELRYERYSDDGRTFYQGMIASKCPPSIFDTGENVFLGDLEVAGEHRGELKARVVFSQATHRDPVMLSTRQWEDGNPASYGYARYDGEEVLVENMMP